MTRNEAEQLTHRMSEELPGSASCAPYLFRRPEWFVTYVVEDQTRYRVFDDYKDGADYIKAQSHVQAARQ